MQLQDHTILQTPMENANTPEGKSGLKVTSKLLLFHVSGRVKQRYLRWRENGVLHELAVSASNTPREEEKMERKGRREKEEGNGRG